MTRQHTHTTTDQFIPAQQEIESLPTSSLLPHEPSHLQNNYLNQLFPQLINRHRVVQIFYTPQTTLEKARLIVHLQSKNETDTLQNQKWVAKLHRRHNTFAHFFYSTQLHHLKKTGNPFILAYCKPSALMYANKDYEGHLLVNLAKNKKHLKKYKAYKEQFYHDHDILKAQISPMVDADCSSAVLLHYENLLNHDLDCLESLYKGIPTRHQTLNERMMALVQYAPQIQKYFVKKTANSFHLIDLIEKAKEASVEAECFFGSEHYQAFEIAEAAVFHMVENRFHELKPNPREGGDLVNPNSTPHSQDYLCRDLVNYKRVTPSDFLDTIVKRKLYRGAPRACPQNTNLHQAITTIQKTKTPEEIYLFHHSVYGNTQTCYLLLIGNGFGNQLLKGLTAKIKAQTGNNMEFVLIAHSRTWIQEWLYAHQDFFKKIIKEENRIFTTSPYHPTPHWEHPYTPDYPDLKLYHSRTVQVFDQFLLMADSHTDNLQGVANLFSLFFQTFCKTYLFATLSYYPNNLHIWALWQLCLYANPNLKHYEYLFNQLDIPFFNFLDQYRTIQLTYPFKHKRKTNILIDIADKLVNELENKLLPLEHRPPNPP